MAVWKFATTDIVTGTTLCDDVPVQVSSLTRAIGEISSGSVVVQDYENYSSFLLPRRTILWALADGVPKWHGVIRGLDFGSASSGVVTLQLKGFESIFEKRRIKEDKIYSSEDVYDIFRDLSDYATDKTYGGIANYSLADDVYGEDIDRTYRATDHNTIYELWNNLAATKDFEWQANPFLVDNVLTTEVSFGKPQFTTTFTPTFYFPGDISDYSWPINGNDSYNSVTYIGDQQEDGTVLESESDHGIYQTDFDDGYPLEETVLSAAGKGIINQDTINANADAEVVRRAGSTASPTITMSITDDTPLSWFNIGGYINVSLTSAIHPSDDVSVPGYTGNLRIVGINIVPGQSGVAESVVLTLGEVLS